MMVKNHFLESEEPFSHLRRKSMHLEPIFLLYGILEVDGKLITCEIPFSHMFSLHPDTPN